MAIFVDGVGTAAASSGVLSRLEGRIFGLLYLHEEPLALDDIATALDQSKSNISINIRGLIEWHLIRRVPVAGSRKDHYEAATNFWRVFQEIMERRFRWCVKQVLSAIADAEHALASERREGTAFLRARLAALRGFFTAIDVGIAAFAQGNPFDPGVLKNVVPLLPASLRRRG